MSIAFVEKIDMILRLFDGDISLSELVSMDMSSQRAMVQARLSNLKKSQEAFEQGRIDAYSRRYASTMTGPSLSTSSIQYKASSPSSDEDEGQNSNVIDRSKSRNAKDYR